jgi:lipid II:glycine glycyltransferase (peptidoglycan interpeptide bridge formation enzyme)
VIDYLKDHGWRYSQDQIQFRISVWLDLSGTEEELLARFKQKTRYNVRLAARKGISIRIGTEADFPELFTMYAETSLRDGFVIRSRDYYDHVWRIFFSRIWGCH